MAPQVRPLVLKVTLVKSCLKYPLYFPDIGPKFYSVRPSSLIREERGDDVVDMGIDEEVWSILITHNEMYTHSRQSVLGGI